MEQPTGRGNAGMNILTDPNNLVPVYGHQGPHPPKYHNTVLQFLNEAVKGCAPGTPEYKQSLINGLNILRILTPGDELNQMVTKSFFPIF